jgi:hypothetical protein
MPILIRIRIQLFTGSAYNADADPDPAVNLNADPGPDPAFHLNADADPVLF